MYEEVATRIREFSLGAGAINLKDRLFLRVRGDTLNRFHFGNLVEQFPNSLLIGRIVIHRFHKPLIILLNKRRGCQPKCGNDLDFRHSLLIEKWKQELRALNLPLLLALAKRILENQNQQA